MITYDRNLDGMQEFTKPKTAFDKLIEFYWVRTQDKLNLDVWRNFTFIDEKHIDLLAKSFQDNWITIDKSLFNKKENGDTNTGTEDVNTSSNKTTNTEWKLENNKSTSWRTNKGKRK